MLNNCYTVHQSPVFRNPKSNIAVQQLTQYINNTQGRISPLHPSVKKIVGIKKNSSTDHQLPLCEVPFQTNLFAQHEASNDLSYSNRGNLSTNRQFSRNQRTHSVYTGNKENYVRSPTRSPFQKPVLQRECYTPIYSKSPLQKVQSPGIQTMIRHTNQMGFGHVSPLRLQQKVYQKEPQLCEMVDNLKQNIIRDIQEVTKKYTNNLQVNKPQEYNRVVNDTIKQQEFQKQKYLEQQAQVLQQQIEFIKTQQSKYASQNRISENQANQLKDTQYMGEQKVFKKSEQFNTQKFGQDYRKHDYSSNYFPLQQQQQDRLPLQNLTKQNENINKIDLNQQLFMTSQFLSTEIVDCQEQKNKEHESQCFALKNQHNLFMSPTTLRFEKQTNFADQFKQKQYSPINFTGQSGSTNTNTFSSQSELAKLKSLQLELMQNKPLFEQPIQPKLDINIKKQKFCDISTEQIKYEPKFEERKSIDSQKNVQQFETNQNKPNSFSNLQTLGVKQQRSQIPAYLPPFTKMPEDMDDDYNNQVTISNLSSIVPAEVSANQNKKINVSFESSLEQPQFEYCKGSDCRNTFGPMQLEHILKSPNCDLGNQPEFNLNSSRNKEKMFVKQMPKFSNYGLFSRDDDEEFMQQNIQNKQESEQLNNNSQQNQSMIEIKEDQVSVKFQTLKTRSSKSLENSEKFRSGKKHSTQKTPSSHNTNEKIEEKQIEIQVSSPMNSRITEVNRESPINRRMTNCSVSSSNKQQPQKLSEKVSSHQSQRYENNENNQNELIQEIQEFSSNHSSRYEQIMQNFQSLKNQSKIDACVDQQIKQSVKVNECQHISDFIVFCEKKGDITEGTKKKTVTFNENLIQQSIEQQKATSFSDFMKTKSADLLPESSFSETVVSPVQPRAGISNISCY